MARLTKTLAVLAASLALKTAQGVDIRLFPETGCTGSYLACNNIPQDYCCGEGSYGFDSTAWIGFEGEGDFELAIYNPSTTSRCASLFADYTVEDGSFCTSYSALHSGFAWFIESEKRDAAGQCSGSIQPDTFVTQGRAFNYSAMPSNAKISVGFLLAGTLDVVPSALLAYEIAHEDK